MESEVGARWQKEKTDDEEWRARKSKMKLLAEQMHGTAVQECKEVSCLTHTPHFHATHNT